MLFIFSVITSLIIIIISLYIYKKIMIDKQNEKDQNEPFKNLATLAPVNIMKNKQKQNGNDINSEVNSKFLSGDMNKNLKVEFANYINEDNNDNFDIEQKIVKSEFISVKSNPKTDKDKVEVTDFKNQLSILNTQLNKAKDELCKLNEKYKINKAKVNELNHSKTRVEEQLESVKSSHSNSLLKIIELERKLAQNNAENHELHKKSELLNTHLKELILEQSRLSNLKTEYENCKSNYEECLLQLKVESQDHANMYKQYEKKIEDLKADRNQTETKRLNISFELLEKDRNIDLLQIELRQLNNLTSETLEEKNQLLENLKVVSLKLETDEKQFLEIINSLKKEFKVKSNELENKIDTMSNELKNKKETITGLLSNKSELQTEIEELTKKFVEKEKLKKEEIENLSSVLNSKIIELEEKNVTFLKEIKQLKTKICEENKEFESKLFELSKQLKESNYDLSVLQDQKIAFLNEINHLKNESAEKNESVGQLHEENCSLRQSVDDLNMKIKDKTNTSSEMEHRMSEIRKELEQKEMGLTLLKNDKQALSNNIDQLTKDLFCNQNKVREMEEILNSKNEETKCLKERLVNAERNNSIGGCVVIDENKPIENTSFEQKSVQNESYDNVIDKMQTHMANLQNELSSLQCKYIELKNADKDLQNSYSEILSEKDILKSDYNQLIEDHNLLYVKYDNVIKELIDSKKTLSLERNGGSLLSVNNELQKYQDENIQLKMQLDQYRDTLEKTETYLQNIQVSVDQEENNWKDCLKSSQLEQERLEDRIKELSNQIEELKCKRTSDTILAMPEDTPLFPNGPLLSEMKKKKKNKNKRKKNKSLNHQ